MVIQGKIIDKKTKEPLYMTNVFLSDESGKPILVNDRSIGTASNLDGEFTLKTPFTANYLTAQFVGYKKQTKPVQDHLYFEMDQTAYKLPEVQIIASRIKKFEWKKLVYPGILFVVVLFLILKFKR